MFTLSEASEGALRQAPFLRQGRQGAWADLVADSVSHREPRGELRGAELSALTIEYPYSMG